MSQRGNILIYILTIGLFLGLVAWVAYYFGQSPLTFTARKLNDSQPSTTILDSPIIITLEDYYTKITTDISDKIYNTIQPHLPK